MYGQKPLKRKFFDIGPPVSKRDVENKNQYCDKGYFHILQK